jgi:transcriptional regulator with XRE-family HTH domain
VTWWRRELAQRLGSSQADVANVEAGRENLTLGKLAQLAGAPVRVSVCVIVSTPGRALNAGGADRDDGDGRDGARAQVRTRLFGYESGCV